MKTKQRKLAVTSALAAGIILFSQYAPAQSTAPVHPAELETAYTSAIENRTQDILKALDLADSAKSDSVHDILISQYRIMRARDALIDAQLEAEGKDINYSNRAVRLEAESKVLHEYFLKRLARVLTPEQVEKVKDHMTYNKVKVTCDAYNVIVPELTATDKDKILELLKVAREKAMDGGSASEKSQIFMVYKEQINDYLNAHGHDVTKAYKEWEAKQPSAQNQASISKSNTAQ